MRAPLHLGHFRAGVDLALGRRTTIRSRRPVSEDSVERLSVIDGVICAVGWTTGADPVLVYDTDPLAAQACVRYPRRGVYDQGKTGFRIAAAIPDKAINNSKVAIRFDNGNVLRPTPKGDQSARALFAQFRGMVAAQTAPSMIEIGSRARSGVVRRHLFPQVQRYLGIDIKEGPNVDFVTDAHTLAGVEEKFDFAYSASVFEHLMMPWVAAQALNRVLNDGAVIYIPSHPAWPLHEMPWDFFRFSKDAWHSIFNAFTGFELLDAGYAVEATMTPVCMEGDPSLQGLDEYPTYLLSSCLARKVGEPKVDWLVDPAEIYDLQYSH